MTRLAESKFTVDQKDLAKECVAAGGDAKAGKWSGASADVYGCLEKTTKINDTVAKALAELVTRASTEVRQRETDDWDQCRHDVMTCQASPCGAPKSVTTVGREAHREVKEVKKRRVRPSPSKCQRTRDEGICWSIATAIRDDAGLPPYPTPLPATVYGYNPSLRIVNALEILVHLLEELRKSGCNDKDSMLKSYASLRHQNCDDLAFRLKQASGMLDIALKPVQFAGAMGSKFGN